MSSRGASDRPITFEGVYDGTRTYHPRMMVTYLSGVYLSVARTTGSTPDPSLVTPWLPLGGGGTSTPTLFAYDYASVP